MNIYDWPVSCSQHFQENGLSASKAGTCKDIGKGATKAENTAKTALPGNDARFFDLQVNKGKCISILPLLGMTVATVLARVSQTQAIGIALNYQTQAWVGGTNTGVLTDQAAAAGMEGCRTSNYLLRK